MKVILSFYVFMYLTKITVISENAGKNSLNTRYN